MLLWTAVGLTRVGAAGAGTQKRGACIESRLNAQASGAWAQGARDSTKAPGTGSGEPLFPAKPGPNPGAPGEPLWKCSLCRKRGER